MIKQLFTALFAFMLVAVFSTAAPAQDKAEKMMKEKQEQVKEMKKEGMKMEGMKMEGMKTVACDPACGFRVTSHDEAELISMVKMHAKKMHGKDMTDAEVKGMMKTAGNWEKKDMEMKKKKEEMMKEKKDDGHSNH